MFDVLGTVNQDVCRIAALFTASCFFGVVRAGAAFARISLGSRTLLAAGRLAGTDALAGRGAGTAGSNEFASHVDWKLCEWSGQERLGFQVSPDVPYVAHVDDFAGQIGRASCRERM